MSTSSYRDELEKSINGGVVDDFTVCYRNKQNTFYYSAEIINL